MVHFFRINDKSSLNNISNPNLITLGMVAVAWLISLIILKEYFTFLLVSWVVEYLVLAVIFSSSVRITLAKIMHLTRYSTILASPTEDDQRWVEANKPLFQKLGIKLYEGELNKKDNNLATIKNNELKRSEIINEEINISYD